MGRSRTCISHLCFPSAARYSHPDHYPLCYDAEYVDAGLYALDGNLKTVEEALDQLQFYQQSRRRRPSQHKTVRELVKDYDQTVKSRRETHTESRKMQELKRRISQLEKALEERKTPAKPDFSEIQDLWSRILEMALKETSRELSAFYQRGSGPLPPVQ